MKCDPLIYFDLHLILIWSLAYFCEQLLPSAGFFFVLRDPILFFGLWSTVYENHAE